MSVGDDNHSIIANSIGIIILTSRINVERVIIGVTKIKMMVTIFYDITKGKILENDMNKSLKECFFIAQHISLGCLR